MEPSSIEKKCVLFLLSRFPTYVVKRREKLLLLGIDIKKWTNIVRLRLSQSMHNARLLLSCTYHSEHCIPSRGDLTSLTFNFRLPRTPWRALYSPSPPALRRSLRGATALRCEIPSRAAGVNKQGSEMHSYAEAYAASFTRLSDDAVTVADATAAVSAIYLGSQGLGIGYFLLRVAHKTFGEERRVRRLAIVYRHSLLSTIY